MIKSHPGVFESRVAEAAVIWNAPERGKTRKDLEVIENDLDRTFPHHSYFAEKGGPGQDTLRCNSRQCLLA